MANMEALLKRELGCGSVKATGHSGGGCISQGQSYDTDRGRVFVKVNPKAEVWRLEAKIGAQRVRSLVSPSGTQRRFSPRPREYRRGLHPRAPPPNAVTSGLGFNMGILGDTTFSPMQRPLRPFVRGVCSGARGGSGAHCRRVLGLLLAGPSLSSLGGFTPGLSA
uniref:Fructosamine 3 kinase related protein n=1 Tax=Equus asinus TaxID=9793 RepID=A0A9L0I4Y2_EQUAS